MSLQRGGELIQNNILPSIEPITTPPTTYATLIRTSDMRVLFTNNATIPVQANTIINQNDTFHLPLVTLGYNQDHTLNQDIIVDDIILINTTQQEYLSLQNTNTHTETTGMTQEIITSSKVQYNVSLDTNKLTCYISNIITLQAHGWTKNEDYTLIILQEDEKIEIPFTAT